MSIVAPSCMCAKSSTLLMSGGLMCIVVIPELYADIQFGGSHE